MASINIVTTEGEELAFQLSQPSLSVGRESDNDIVIPDGSMSSHHAEIVETAEGYQLTDLGSTNGTQVNGQRIDSALLSDGDSITLGHVSGVFSAGSGPAAGVGAPPPPARSAAAPASRSKTPGSFSNSSPFTKKEKVKDPKGQAIMAVGILGIIAAIASMALSLIMRAN
jgi:pSer/pThr/pTyr-binding forkhead associated (FHA) protein